MPLEASAIYLRHAYNCPWITIMLSPRKTILQTGRLAQLEAPIHPSYAVARFSQDDGRADRHRKPPRSLVCSYLFFDMRDYKLALSGGSSLLLTSQLHQPDESSYS